jgi:hypothetical protein
MSGKYSPSQVNDCLNMGFEWGKRGNGARETEIMNGYYGEGIRLTYIRQQGQTLELPTRQAQHQPKHQLDQD